MDRNKLTKQQLEEQKMNEAAGLPSNLDEATRVVNLENQVSQISESVGQMANLLKAMVQQSQLTPSLAGLPPTHQVRPAAAPRQRPSPEQIVAEAPQPPTFPPLGLLTEPVIDVPVTPESQADTSPRNSPPQDSPEMSISEAVREQMKPVAEDFRQWKERRDELAAEETQSIDDLVAQKKQELAELEQQVATPQVSLGGVGSGATDSSLEELSTGVAEAGQRAGKASAEAYWGEDELRVEETPEEPPTPEERAEDKRLERQQILTDQVCNWLMSKDPHKFFRQFVGGTCNKNLSYNTWPQGMQVAFDERFNAMIADAEFVSTLCGRITKFQNGHLVAPHVAGAFVTVIAGFLSFALSEA
jgi:hypothetical protein